ncbi:hypothetical protein NT05LI_3254, partial [Listeria ivanovii FSL F6-596]
MTIRWKSFSKALRTSVFLERVIPDSRRRLSFKSLSHFIYITSF